MRRTPIAGIAMAAFALGTAEASAAVRYAEPVGNGPEASCPKSDPCDIVNAIEGPSVGDGDEVVVLPGTYDIGSAGLTVSQIEVHGAVGEPRPVIESSSSSATLYSPVGDIHDLELRNDGGGRAFFGYPAGAMERIVARGDGDYACFVPRGAPARDSVCVNTGQGAGLGATVGGSATLDFELRNVTAFGTGTGAGAYGIFFNGTGGIAMNVDARNVIAEGGTAAADVGADEDTADVDIDLDFSNYSGDATLGGATVTPFGTASNQTEAPDFVDAGAFDFHQLPSSPTIDAGTAASGIGSLDIDRQPRIQGSAPDIGADEFDDQLKLKVKAKKKQKAKKLKVKVQCPEEECTAVAKGKATVGGESFKLKRKQKFLNAGQKKKLKLKPKNLDRLEELLAVSDGKAKIKVKGTDSGGVTAKKKLGVELVG